MFGFPICSKYYRYETITIGRLLPPVLFLVINTNSYTSSSTVCLTPNFQEADTNPPEESMLEDPLVTDSVEENTTEEAPNDHLTAVTEPE